MSKVAEKAEPRHRLKAWEIVLLVLGAPIWLSLLIAAVAVVISLYASLWSVIVSLWAAFGSVAGAAVGSLLSGVGFTLGENTLLGVFMIGAGLICAGASIFLFFGCMAATNGTVLLTKKIAIWLICRFTSKGAAK